MTTRVPYSMTDAPVNVLALGAKGDGTTDDTAVINAALTDQLNQGTQVAARAGIDFKHGVKFPLADAQASTPTHDTHNV